MSEKGLSDDTRKRLKEIRDKYRIKPKDYNDLWRFRKECQEGVKPYLVGVIPDLKRIHKILKKKGHISRETSYEFNDCDNHSWIREKKGWEVTCFSSQNFNFMVGYQKGGIFGDKLIMYKFFEHIDPEDIEEYEGWEKILTSAEWVVENYSDEIPENQYIHRPTEDYLLERLDKNNIFFYPVINLGELFRVVGELGEVESFFLDVSSTLLSLKEDYD